MLAEAKEYNFTNTLDTETNPLEIYVNSLLWKGASIAVSVWDQEEQYQARINGEGKMFVPFDAIDDFVLDYNSSRNGVTKTYVEKGLRPFDKTV